MSSNFVKVYTVTMTSGQTQPSSALDLTKPYEQMMLAVPTMASGSLHILISDSLAGTYMPINQKDPNQSTTFTINSASTQRIAQIPTGYRFMKIQNTSGATDVVTVFKIICSD